MNLLLQRILDLSLRPLIYQRLQIIIYDWRFQTGVCGPTLMVVAWHIKVNNVLEQESLYMRHKPSMLNLAELG